MALLQALPDLPPGDDEDEDKLLAELATGFTAEDLQLLYQIAINSRRDLDYAPDARAGFEMALLRMLAFRPQSLPPAATAGGGGAGVARATAAARAASAPSRPASSASPAAAVASAPAADSDWDALVVALGLQGTAKHFAANCVLLERTAGLVRLRLDPAGDSFRRPQIEQRLAEALSQHYGETIRLEITQAGAPGEILTPARRDTLATEDRQRAAEQSIESDPAVRAMREVFGATVRPGSVKPLN
jgi:DNA polymerase-3 subunit gamma/tau